MRMAHLYDSDPRCSQERMAEAVASDWSYLSLVDRFSVGCW